MRLRTEYIIIDCSHTPPSLDIGMKYLDRRDRSQGWLMIGVHYVITRDGGREVGRPVGDVGGFSPGYNHKSVGILLVGGRQEGSEAPESNYTHAQLSTLGRTLQELRRHYPDAQIVGQYQVQTEQVGPCFDVPQYVYRSFQQTHNNQHHQQKKTKKEGMGS